MFKNFIFDWSGTLADDLALVVDATNSVFRHYGLDELNHFEFKSQFRLPYSEFYADVLPEIQLEELEDVFRLGFRTSDKSVTLLPYAREFMEYCRDRKIRCFALTSVDKDDFEHQVTDLGMKPYFEAIYSGVLNKTEVIHSLMETHSLRTNETAFIGDMTHDVETAASAGITSIAVLTGYQNADQLSQATPDIITPDLHVLRRLLDKRTHMESLRHSESDCIRINGLTLSCHIGVPEEERRERQPIKAHLTLYPDFSMRHLKEDINRTIDYAKVAECVKSEAEDRPRILLETLTEDIGNIILREFPVKQVHVRLEKFILPDTDSVSIELTLPT